MKETAFKIDFDARDHSYRVDGKRMDSVTQVLKYEGFIDTRWYKPSGTARGTLVHQGTEAIDRGDLRADDFAGQEIYMYLKAWESFVSDSALTMLHIERSVGSKKYEYVILLMFYILVKIELHFFYITDYFRFFIF